MTDPSYVILAAKAFVIADQLTQRGVFCDLDRARVRLDCAMRLKQLLISERSSDCGEVVLDLSEDVIERLRRLA